MYTAAFKRDGKWIVAWIEEIPGVNTQGRTMREARENLQNALELMLEYNREVSQESTKKDKTIKREPFELAR